jgi:hypothetical protein
VVCRTVLSNDWAFTWGYFEATLDLRPFRGKGTLRVGTESARDGTFEGIEVVPVRGRCPANRPIKAGNPRPIKAGNPKDPRARLTLNRKFCTATVKQ